MILVLDINKTFSSERGPRDQQRWGKLVPPHTHESFTSACRVYRPWGKWVGASRWGGGSKVRTDSARWGDNSTVSGCEEGGSEEEEEEVEECVQKGGFSWVGVVSVGELTASPFPLGPTTLYYRDKRERGNRVLLIVSINTLTHHSFCFLFTGEIKRFNYILNPRLHYSSIFFPWDGN